jgi:hypothetical protein
MYRDYNTLSQTNIMTLLYLAIPFFGRRRLFSCGQRIRSKKSARHPRAATEPCVKRRDPDAKDA